MSTDYLRSKRLVAIRHGVPDALAQCFEVLPAAIDLRLLASTQVAAEKAALRLHHEVEPLLTIDLDGTTYCYLYMDDDHSQNESRRIMLAAMCHVARKVFPTNTRVVGIATEKTFAPTCTYDFGLVDISEWTDAHEAEATRIRSNLGLFVDPKIREISEDEYPQPE